MKRNEKMNNSEIEKIISEEILTDDGVVGFDINDVQKLKTRSDFIDGVVIDGKLDNLGEQANKAIMQMKEVHPQSPITMLMLKIAVAKGYNITMEQLDTLLDTTNQLGDDISIMWGLEVNATLPDETHICFLCRFKKA